MKTKPFNSVLQNVPYKEVTSGMHEEIEILCGDYIVIFALDCDISIEYFSPSTYLNPEEYELNESKEISNIKVFSSDYETQYSLNNVQGEKLAQEIDDNLKIVY